MNLVILAVVCLSTQFVLAMGWFATSTSLRTWAVSIKDGWKNDSADAIRDRMPLMANVLRQNVVSWKGRPHLKDVSSLWLTKRKVEEDHGISIWVLYGLFGGVLLMYAFYKAFIKPDFISLSFITPNYINLVLLATGIVLHGSIYKYLRGIDDAIGGASGILIQFPLYFGIMGIMKYSGMVGIFSDFFVQISNEVTFPIFTFISAGIVNVFVPSGGGQWGVQGPIIIEAASQLNVPYWKAVMSLAYGDQITNMLQPFWALPLLGITGLKAKEILPYTLLLLLIGSVIFISGLLIF